MKRKYLIIGTQRAQFTYPSYIVAVDIHPILGAQYNRKFIGVDTVSIYKDILIPDKKTYTETSTSTSIYTKKKTPSQRVQVTYNQDYIIFETVEIKTTTNIQRKKVKTDIKTDFKKSSRCLSGIAQSIEHKDLISIQMYNCLVEYQSKSIKVSQNFNIINLLSSAIITTTQQIILTSNNIKEIFNHIDILTDLEMDMIRVEEEIMVSMQDLYKSANAYQTLYQEREQLNGFSYGSSQKKSIKKDDDDYQNWKPKKKNTKKPITGTKEKTKNRRNKIFKQKNKRLEKRDDKRIVRDILQDLDQSSYGISMKKKQSYQELQWWQDYKKRYVLLKKRRVSDRLTYEDLIIKSFHY